MKFGPLLVGMLGVVTSASGVAAKQCSSRELMQDCDILTKEINTFSKHVKSLQRPGQLTQDRLDKAHGCLNKISSSIVRLEEDFGDSVPVLLAEAVTDPQGLKKLKDCVYTNNQRYQSIVKEELPALKKKAASEDTPNRNTTTAKSRRYPARVEL